MGVRRVILGTAALNNLALVQEALKRFPGRIAAGIDASNGFVAVKGWTEVTSEKAADLAKKLYALGVDTLIYTDIARDGTLEGPSLESTREMIQTSGMRVIASGGAGKLGDLFALEALGASGAIVGKAIYDGRIDLKEALGAFGE
jgi:phosphoribosylformimino-5-aminoimidazole carboxamide ribotide isomerase